MYFQVICGTSAMFDFWYIFFGFAGVDVLPFHVLYIPATNCDVPVLKNGTTISAPTSPTRKRTVLKTLSPLLFSIALNTHKRGGARPESGRKKRNCKRVKRSLKKNINYARARRRIWYGAEKGRKIQQSRLDRETRIDALKEALSGNSSLECLLVGEKTWNRAN